MKRNWKVKSIAFFSILTITLSSLYSAAIPAFAEGTAVDANGTTVVAEDTLNGTEGTVSTAVSGNETTDAVTVETEAVQAEENTGAAGADSTGTGSDEIDTVTDGTATEAVSGKTEKTEETADETKTDKAAADQKADEKEQAKVTEGAAVNSDGTFLEADLTASDKRTFKITITADKAAEIPSGSALRVEELSKERTQDYLKKTYDVLKWNDDDVTFYGRAFDISIIYEGKAVIPAAPVKVTVTLMDLADNAAEAKEASELLQAVRFDEGNIDRGTEIKNVEGKAENTECSVTFSTPSLSVFGICGKAPAIKQWITGNLGIHVYGLRGNGALSMDPVEAASAEEGLEVIDAYTVNGSRNMWMDIICDSDTAAGELESLSLYSVSGGKLGTLLASDFSKGDNVFLPVKEVEGFALVKDTGLRYRHVEADPGDGGSISIEGMLPGDATATAEDVIAEDADGSSVLAYDVSVMNGGDEYQPVSNEPVTVSISNEAIAEASENEISLWSVGKTGEEEITDYSVKGDTITFETNEFSVYKVEGIVLDKTITTSDGKTYRVTVTFDENANLPDDVDLGVEEITDDDERFAGYLVAAAGRLDKNAEDIPYSRIFDISLISKNNPSVHYQPDADVAVTIELIGESEETVSSLKVLHITDGGVDIMDASAEGAMLNFSTDSFSIYPIVDDDDTGANARIGYRFWYYNVATGLYEEITTQYFRRADVLEQGARIREPSVPGINESDFVRIFEGWHKGTVDGESVILEDPAVTVADLNAELEVNAADSTYLWKEGNITDVICKLKSAYYITYVDVNANNILSTDLVVKQNEGDTYFTVKSGIKPTKYENKLMGWRLIDDIMDPDAPLYRGGIQYPISSNITLAPVIDGGYWLVFDDNDLVDDGTGKMVSGGASYTAPAFYMNSSEEQQVTIEPEAPTWTGYEFGGWYEDKACTIPFVFGELLSSNKTVYAKWTPSNSSYRVIVWKQQSTDSAYASDDDKKYDYDFSDLIEDGVTTGELEYLDVAYTRIYGEDGTSTDTDKQYFVYNAAKSDSYVIVKADGTSVMNVYYDRVPMTMNFYTYGTNDYVYTETDADSGTQYGLVNGEYVLLESEGGDDIYNYTYQPTYTATEEDTGTQYGIIDGEYKELERRAAATYRTHYTVTPATGTGDGQYGVVDGEFEQLRYGYTYTWEGTQYEYTEATDDQGTQYGLIDGDYQQLSRNTVYSYTWRNGNNNYNGDLYPYRSYYSTDYTSQTRFVSPIPDDYYPRYSRTALRATRTGTGEEAWVDSNGAEFTGTRYTRTENTGTHTYTGTLYEYWTTWQGVDYYREFYGTDTGTTDLYALVDGDYILLNRSEPHWTVVSTGETFTGNRYRLTQNYGSYDYNGTRYLRSGSSAPYTYTETTEDTGTQYAVVNADNGHIALDRRTGSYVYYYNDELYTGTRYTENAAPSDYSGQRYTLDNGVYHATGENGEGLYGKDANNVFRPLNYTMTPGRVWTYTDGDGVKHVYSGTRYTRSNTTYNRCWQIYKSFTGLYGSTLDSNGFTWPDEYNWYANGHGRGGNTETTTTPQQATTSGSRMTLKTTFEPLEGETTVKFYGNTLTTTGSVIIFYVQNLDGTYVEKDRFYTGGNNGSFQINDKYTGFHASQYRAGSRYGGQGPWTDVEPKNAGGYYGDAISYYNTFEVRFDRTQYKLSFFTENGSNEVIEYAIPFGADISDYASQGEGQKTGYYFVGWFADAAHTTPFNFNTVMPDHNVNVYGYWRMERIRVVIHPGANNVYMGNQGLTFRLDYDEQIGGARLEAATRTGYILDGWYTDPEFTNKWIFSTPVNSDVEGVDMTYHTAAKWAAARMQYGDDDAAHENVRGIIQLYAKWIVDSSEKGVNIVYDAGEGGTANTTVPIDPRLYQDGSDVIVGAAPLNYSDLFIFDYWEAVDSEGNVITVVDDKGNRITQLPPGTVFNVDGVDPYSTIEDEEGEVIIKTIMLRAKYTRSSEAEEHYTTITYDGNTFTDSIYPSGSEVLKGRARDGSERYTVTVDKEINETVELPGADDFYLDGYTLVGWSFLEGDYAYQTDPANLGDDINFEPGQLVAADKLKQTDLNDEANTLYAMWRPKTYSVKVNQVIESGVTDTSFTYTYKYGVENVLDTSPAGSGNITLVGDDFEEWTDQFQYYGRVGHVFNITVPVIPETKDYAVRVNAVVTRDDGTRETLELNSSGNYEILGNVEITYTYSLKVPVTLEKRALDDNSLLTGSAFVLTPMEYNSETQHWEQIGTTSFTYDMSSVSSMTQRLQEGVYRVTETTAPENYAKLSEPLLLTVKRNGAFVLRNMTSGEVNDNVAKITGSDGHTLTVLDRPIQAVTIKKEVDGQDLESSGYVFDVLLTLDGSPIAHYDTVGEGAAADTTNSAGIIQFRLAKDASKTLYIPWGSVIEITERDYPQYAVTTVSAEDVEDTETETGRIYRCNVEKDDTVTFINKNLDLTVTKEVTGDFGEPDRMFTFAIGGLLPGKNYRLNIAGTSVTRTSTAEGTIVFQLKHGQSMVIPLIEGGRYTVSETQEDGYYTSLKVNEGIKENATTREITLNTATTVAFTNYRPAIAPTGYDSNKSPFIAVLFAGFLLGLVSLVLRMSRLRKTSKE